MSDETSPTQDLDLYLKEIERVARHLVVTWDVARRVTRDFHRLRLQEQALLMEIDFEGDDDCC